MLLGWSCVPATVLSEGRGGHSSARNRGLTRRCGGTLTTVRRVARCWPPCFLRGYRLAHSLLDELPHIPDLTWLGDAARTLDVSEAHLRWLISDGAFPSARTIGSGALLVVLDPGDVERWSSLHADDLINRVPRSRSRETVRDIRASEIVDRLPGGRFLRVTVELRSGNYGWLNEPIGRPRSIEDMGLAQKVLDDCADYPTLTLPYIDQYFSLGSYYAGPHHKLWQVAYLERHPDCVVLGGPIGRAAFRVDQSGLETELLRYEERYERDAR